MDYRAFHLLLLPIVLLFSNALAQEGSHGAVERLLQTPAQAIDPALDAVSLGDWLAQTVPQGSDLTVQPVPCDPIADDAGSPACIALDYDIVSRHRQLRLVFSTKHPAFEGGMVSATELEGDFAVGSLADLGSLLRRAMRPFPIACPADAQLKLRESYAGLSEWCETGGIRQGPSRDWFSTGVYLMSRGNYIDGQKSGDWVECDRFERCAKVTYQGGVRQ